MNNTTTPQNQRKLLDLQVLDNQLTRVREQLETIRMDKQLSNLRQQGAQAVKTAKMKEAEVVSHRTAVTTAEQQVADTLKRRDGMQKQLDAGDVASRDMQAVTIEIAELTIRATQQEEAQLEAIQALEDVQGELEHAQAKIVDAQQAVNVRIETINEQGKQLSLQGKELQAERTLLVGDIPGALVQEYDKLREQNHGIAVVELTSSGLSGAGLPIAPAELAEIRKTPDDELAYCPDTGAILIRS